jgi:crotonobetainyl-CoA:carnitine CoA-transferase CaiB-like acyl-CoA transferase
LVLADLGATVDKLEDLGGGDYLRVTPPQIAGESAAFQLLNRGKRSALLDLKNPAGNAAFRRLVKSYDVLFEQFRPGVLARLGLGHDALRAEIPRLIICALTGYGQTGVLTMRAGHDINYLARGGILGAQGPKGAAPQVPGFQLADVSGGMWCVIAIQAALAERAKTGQGCVLDIAMTDGLLGFASISLAAALAQASTGRADSATGSHRNDETLSGGIAPYQIYLSSDGHPMTIGALEPKFWTGFCAATGLEIGMEALFVGPHQEELKARVSAIFRGRTREEWIAFGAQHDCLVEPVIEPSELLGDAHIESRGLLFHIPSPRGDIPQFRTPVTPKDAAFTPAPRAGEHTRAVFRDAGFNDGEIDELARAGAIREAG